ncbi:D-aminoacyl-tRNA deacylase [Haloarculaceae archaeon H-GB2-1]|nr:D-aminoacyl-tRNA deacylase [Haloarculaceae archaeon H-GB1-1]MEA5407800.1 D-aminoacyl-tRNA deacylase [Haloarculaceae archaeon H-GB2-1]
MLAIAVSRADSASVHIGDFLRELREWDRSEDESLPDADGGGTVYRTDGIELREFDEWHLHLTDVADAFSDTPELLVFPSRHAGETDELLTAHFTGNFGPAEYGGDDHALAQACPNAHRRVEQALREYAPEAYEVGMECTHHGPTSVGAPSMFVEIGSAEPQWDDPAAARAAARAILDLGGVEATTDRTVVGFGGGHYVPRYERIVRETDWAVGHVAADWCLDEMGLPDRRRDVVSAAFERSDASRAVIEGDHPKLEAVVEEEGYRVVSETWVREVDGVPLSFAEAVEAELGEVSEGTRFGEPATGYDESWTTASLPEELLAEADGVDADATLAALDETALAYETTQSGTRAGTRIAVPAESDRERVVDAVVDVLRRKYDEVERRDDAVVLHETAFDPELASRRGVPEGPKFGKLSAGHSVTVGDETVNPEEVHADERREIEL